MHEFSTLEALHKHLINGTVSVSELVLYYLNRIKQINPKLNCYITLCTEGILQSATKQAEKILASGTSTWLTGIPFALKDNLCTNGVRTTCASKMLEHFVPTYSATAVQNLLNDHSVLLGKLNMDEFSMGSSTTTSYFGATKNPHNLNCVPGGSSGGAAACVAADLAVFALGSDTGGSIRQPAAFCGCVGFKPTYGLVSRYGLIAYASSLDHVGCLTRCVRDSAIVLNGIAGQDAKDATSAPRPKTDYLTACNGNIKHMKIAVPKQYLVLAQPEIASAVQQAVKTLERLGAVCEYIDFSLSDAVLSAYYIIASAEASSNLARYDGVKFGFRANQYTDLQDMYKKTRGEGFGHEVKKRILFGTYVLSEEMYDAYYSKAFAVRQALQNQIQSLFESYDLILTPTTPTTAYSFTAYPAPLSVYQNDICTITANMAGLPAISVPAGFDRSGLPIGIQFIGKQFADDRVLNIAFAFEQATDFVNKHPCM